MVRFLIQVSSRCSVASARCTPMLATCPPGRTSRTACSKVCGRPTASIVTSAPRPPGSSPMISAGSSRPLLTTMSAPNLRAAPNRESARSIATMWLGLNSCAVIIAASPIGPAPMTATTSAGRTAPFSHRGHLTYLDQHGPYGNGTPVLNAARSFGDEPVLVLWPDDVFVAEVPRAQQLIRAYEQTSCPVLALMPMTPEHSQRYGVPIVKEDLDDGLLRITGLVEKPKPQDAPSSYAAIGGYVVTPGVVDELREQT